VNGAEPDAGGLPGASTGGAASPVVTPSGAAVAAGRLLPPGQTADAGVAAGSAAHDAAPQQEHATAQDDHFTSPAPDQDVRPAAAHVPGGPAAVAPAAAPPDMCAAAALSVPVSVAEDAIGELHGGQSAPKAAPGGGRRQSSHSRGRGRSSSSKRPRCKSGSAASPRPTAEAGCREWQAQQQQAALAAADGPPAAAVKAAAAAALAPEAAASGPHQSSAEETLAAAPVAGPMAGKIEHIQAEIAAKRQELAAKKRKVEAELRATEEAEAALDAEEVAALQAAVAAAAAAQGAADVPQPAAATPPSAALPPAGGKTAAAETGQPAAPDLHPQKPAMGRHGRPPAASLLASASTAASVASHAAMGAALVLPLSPGRRESSRNAEQKAAPAERAMQRRLGSSASAARSSSAASGSCNLTLRGSTAELANKADSAAPTAAASEPALPSGPAAADAPAAAGAKDVAATAGAAAPAPAAAAESQPAAAARRRSHKAEPAPLRSSAPSLKYVESLIGKRPTTAKERDAWYARRKVIEAERPAAASTADGPAAATDNALAQPAQAAKPGRSPPPATALAAADLAGGRSEATLQELPAAEKDDAAAAAAAGPQAAPPVQPAELPAATPAYPAPASVADAPAPTSGKRAARKAKGAAEAPAQPAEATGAAEAPAQPAEATGAMEAPTQPAAAAEPSPRIASRLSSQPAHSPAPAAIAKKGRGPTTTAERKAISLAAAANKAQLQLQAEAAGKGVGAEGEAGAAAASTAEAAVPTARVYQHRPTTPRTAAIAQARASSPAEPAADAMAAADAGRQPTAADAAAAPKQPRRAAPKQPPAAVVAASPTAPPASTSADDAPLAALAARQRSAPETAALHADAEPGARRLRKQGAAPKVMAANWSRAACAKISLHAHPTTSLTDHVRFPLQCRDGFFLPKGFQAKPCDPACGLVNPGLPHGSPCAHLCDRWHAMVISSCDDHLICQSASRSDNHILCQIASIASTIPIVCHANRAGKAGGSSTTTWADAAGRYPVCCMILKTRTTFLALSVNGAAISLHNHLETLLSSAGLHVVVCDFCSAIKAASAQMSGRCWSHDLWSSVPCSLLKLAHFHCRRQARGSNGQAEALASCGGARQAGQAAQGRSGC